MNMIVAPAVIQPSGAGKPASTGAEATGFGLLVQANTTAAPTSGGQVATAAASPEGNAQGGAAPVFGETANGKELQQGASDASGSQVVAVTYSDFAGLPSAPAGQNISLAAVPVTDGTAQGVASSEGEAGVAPALVTGDEATQSAVSVIAPDQGAQVLPTVPNGNRVVPEVPQAPAGATVQRPADVPVPTVDGQSAEPRVLSASSGGAPLAVPAPASGGEPVPDKPVLQKAAQNRPVPFIQPQPAGLVAPVGLAQAVLADDGVQAVPVTDTGSPAAQPVVRAVPRNTAGIGPAIPAEEQPQAPVAKPTVATVSDSVAVKTVDPAAVKTVDSVASRLVISGISEGGKSAQAVKTEALDLTVPVKSQPVEAKGVVANAVVSAAPAGASAPLAEGAKLTEVTGQTQVAAPPVTTERKRPSDQTVLASGSLQTAVVKAGNAPTELGKVKTPVTESVESEPVARGSANPERPSQMVDIFAKTAAQFGIEKAVPGVAALPVGMGEPAGLPDRPVGDPVSVLAPDMTTTSAKTAAVQETATAKAPPKPFAEALMAQVKSVAVTDGRTTVNLAPRGLGNIEIDVTGDKDTTTKVVIRVENPAVLQVLRDDRQMLAQAIGVSDSSVFDFQQQSAGDQSGSNREQNGQTGGLFGDTMTPDVVRQHRDVVQGDQLDILT